MIAAEPYILTSVFVITRSFACLHQSSYIIGKKFKQFSRKKMDIMGNFKYDFYVCHDENDASVAENILRHLEETFEEKLKGYLEYRDGHPGKSLLANMEHGIESSKYIILLFSKTAVMNKWFEMKVHASMSHRIDNPQFHATILPVQICSDDGIYPKLPTCLNFIVGAEYDDSRTFFNKLYRTIVRR